MFVIVMDRSVIICSILLTLVTYSSCKSIGRNDENATASASTKPVSIDSPVLPEFPTENLTPKSKLPTLLPSNYETKIRRTEVPDCSSRRNKKTKRCKSLLQRDTRSQLISAEDRRSLKTENYNVGAALNRSPSRPSIIEDDDYVCYCREKNNPLSRQNSQSQPWLTRRTKPERRPDNKRMLPGESRLQKSPLYWHQPYLSDDIHQYLPNPMPGTRNPISRNLGGLPYVPYVYYVDPSSLSMPPNQGQSPTSKHDTIVGKQTPEAYRNRPSVEQPCPPEQSPNRPRIPSVSSKTDKANGNKNVSPTTINPSKKPGNVPKDSLVGTAGPRDGHKSGSGTKHYSDVGEAMLRSTTAAYGVSLGVYTTEVPLRDDLAGVKNIVLGSSNPGAQEEPSNDDLNNDSVMKDNVEVGQSNPLPQEESPNKHLEKDEGNKDPLNHDSQNNENTGLGQSSPLPQEESPIEVLEEDPANADPSNDDSENNDNAALGQGNPLPQEPSTDTLDQNPANMHPLNGKSGKNENSALGQSNPLPQEPSTDTLDQNPGIINPLNGNSGKNENNALGQSNPLPQEESSNGGLDEDLGNTDPLNDDSENNDNAAPGQSNPLPQKPLTDNLDQNPGIINPLNGNLGKNENSALGKSNPLPQEESSNGGLDEDLGNTDPLNDDSENNDNAALGQGYPLPQKPPTNTLKNPEVSMQSKYNDESSSQSPALISNVGDINHDVTPVEFFTDFSEDPLKINQGDLNAGKVDARIDDAENQEGLPNDSSMNGNVTPSSRNNEDLVNEREMVGAGNPVPAGIPNQELPFCDNSLLEKSIKTVINNFAAESDGDTGQEMLGSARDDLLKEIVTVPNLKGILSLPPVERTVLDKVKNMLATVTGLPRSKFDGEWPTNVIRNNLRHSLAAAPSAQTELPPNTVEERQFKGGKWVSSFVTLEPMLKNEDEDSGDNDERLRASVKSLLRDPAVSLEAAEHPIVQNMIVQSVHNTFPNSSSDLIQSVLDNELVLMKLENVETTTADENTGQTQENDLEGIDMNELLEIARDQAGITESGSTSTSDGLLESFTHGYKNSAVGSVLSTQENAQTELPGDIAEKGTSLGQEEESMVGKSQTPTSPNLYEDDVVPTVNLFMTESPDNLVGVTNNPSITKYPGLSSTFPTAQQPSWKINSPLVGQSIAKLIPEDQEGKQKSVTENPCEVSPGRRIADESSGPEEDLESVFPTTPFMVEDAESAEKMVGMQRSEEASPDYAYVGKITVKKNNYSDDIKSLQNSELFYVGDGVKLPLEIRRLSDGSYALSISRKVCEHLLNKDCPCCVPVEGNVLRKVRKQPESEEETVEKKKISKRESILAGSVDSDKPDSADDNSQISMPVETFARRYNLSLNLGKLQTPWNFDRKTDEREKNGATRFGKKNSANANLRSLLDVHGVPENGKSEEMDNSYERSDDVSRYRRQKHRKLDKDRHERNIDEKVNKRVEIVTDVLYWLRDMILSARS